MKTNNEIKGFNIAEALKYAQKGLKLYTPIFGEVKFEKIDEDNCIQVRDKYNNLRWFYEYGTYFPSDESNYTEVECLLFPSVNHRCWQHWQNTLFLESIGSVCVDTITGNRFILGEDGTYFSDNTGNSYHFLIDDKDASNYLLNSRYASPEEAKEFFEEFEKNRYMWNGKKVVEKEQNKPKFKVDDWIVNNETGKISQIKKIVYDKSGYGYDHTNGWFHSVFEKDYHLWTIQDAKDGDVLAAQECLVIFKEIDGLNIKCHCTYHYMGLNPSFHINTLQNKTAFHPATKEQRDILFAKVKEEGYEQNYDTKKLIKTTTPIPKFKVGDIIRNEPTGVFMAIKEIKDDSYITTDGTMLLFKYQDRWELAGKANLSLEAKVSVLADEIIALKEKLLALEKLAKDSEIRVDALECGGKPFETSDKAGDNVTLKDMKS